jgi:hypothetical protein
MTLTLMVAAAIGGAKWLTNLDTRNEYIHAAARLDRSETQKAEAFMRCVLPDLQPSQLTSTVTLYGSVENITEQLGKGYGDQVAACAPLLDDFERSVRGVQAPSDMNAHLQKVNKSASAVVQSWRAYQNYLQTPNQPYDYVQAAPLIDRITVEWSSYKKVNRETKQALTRAL